MTKRASRPKDPPPANEVAWLDPDQHRHWVALSAMLELLPAALDAQLRRDAGINHFEYMILAGLSDAPGRTMGMSQLASWSSGSLSRLSHAISRLEAKGWVTRTPAGSGRAVDVSMTEAGLAAMEGFAPGHVAEARRLVVDALDPKDLADLGRCCRVILEAIDPRHTAMVDAVLEGQPPAHPGSPG